VLKNFAIPCPHSSLMIHLIILNTRWILIKLPLQLYHKVVKIRYTISCITFRIVIIDRLDISIFTIPDYRLILYHIRIVIRNFIKSVSLLKVCCITHTISPIISTRILSILSIACVYFRWSWGFSTLLITSIKYTFSCTLIDHLHISHDYYYYFIRTWFNFNWIELNTYLFWCYILFYTFNTLLELAVYNN
jgi:hypothetical protein